MSVRLVYEDVAVGADTDAIVSSNGARAGSNISKLPFGSEFVPMITLETNQWLLDGKSLPLTEQTFGFVSTRMSGEDAIFTAPPIITVKFSKQYTSLGIMLKFDPSTGEYSNSVTIRWWQGEELLSEQTFYPDGVEYYCETTVEAYNKVEIQFNATALPSRYVRLSSIMFGISRTFSLNELRSVKVTEEISLISTEVAINTMDFTLDSASNIEFLFQRKQPIVAWDGDVLIGAFYVSDSSRSGVGIYDVSCEDAIGILDEEKIPAVMHNGTPIKEALEAALGSYFELDLAPELDGETITGLQPEGTRREVLQQIAFAARAIIDTSGTEKIRVYLSQEGIPNDIPEDRIYSGSTTTTKASVTAVKVTSHSYSTTGSGDTVVVNGKTYYHTTEVITILNPDVTASDKQNVVEITNATLVNPNNVDLVARHAYDYYMRQSTQDVKIVMAGEKPGDLIQTTTPWSTAFKGNIVRMDITLSGISAANCNAIGTT